MKIRTDFVTNSSSSSFILTNKTKEPITSREFVERLFKRILADAEGRFVLDPGESIELECSDDGGDKFEQFIHNSFGAWGTGDYDMDQSEVSVRFHESHH